MKKNELNRQKKFYSFQKRNNDPRIHTSRAESLEERFAPGSLLPFLSGSAPSSPNVEHVDFRVAQVDVKPVEFNNSPSFLLNDELGASFGKSTETKGATSSASTSAQALRFQDVEALNQTQTSSPLTAVSVDVATFDSTADYEANSATVIPASNSSSKLPDGEFTTFNANIAESPVSTLDVPVGLIQPAKIDVSLFNFNALASGAGGGSAASLSSSGSTSETPAQVSESGNSSDGGAEVKSAQATTTESGSIDKNGEIVQTQVEQTGASDVFSQKSGTYKTNLETFSNEQEWTLDVYGSDARRGSVEFADGAATIREGDSFATSLKGTLAVPENAVSFQFSYDNLQFDTSAVEQMSDSFEAALVDSDGYALVSTWTENRDAFYNVSEGEKDSYGSIVTTSLKDGVTTVTVDLDASLAERNVDVVFRLTNNDGDSESSIRLLNYGFVVFTTNVEPVVATYDVEGVEGSEVAITANFTDEDVDDSHVAFVDWGDGSDEESLVVSEQNGIGVASGSHIYADNGVYDVVVRVVDQENGVGTSGVKATIANVAPTVDAWADFAAVANGDYYALETTIVGSFTDPGFDNAALGTTETFVATIDWGDGYVENAPINVVQGSNGVATSGTFKASRILTRDGAQNIKISVADDDDGIGEATLTFVSSTIDVKPAIRNWTRTGRITLRRGYYPVVIGGTNAFDPTTIDVSTLEFGPGAATELDGKLTFGDVARLGLAQDGVTDAIAHFDTWDSLISSSDSVAWLTGQTVDGEAFIGVGTLSVPSLSARVPFAYTENFPRIRATQAAAPATGDSTKFFVVDNSGDQTFKYSASGDYNGAFALSSDAYNVRGVAASADGSTLWTIDSVTKTVSVYSSDGSQIGSWIASDVVSPQGVSVSGDDLWLVDATKKRVLKYEGGATFRTGSETATSSFALRSVNKRASDLVVGDQYIWVTDDNRDAVYVYTLKGSFVGSWKLDPENADPSGITLDPTGKSQDLWVVDRKDAIVYRYADAQLYLDYNSSKFLRTSSATATDKFELVEANSRPEGIADPPTSSADVAVSTNQIEIDVTAPDSTLYGFETGATLTLTGEAVSTTTLADGRSYHERIETVYVNGKAVDALDQNGRFFATVTIATGTNEFSVVVTDKSGNTETQTFVVEGKSESATKFDVSKSFKPLYAQTSFNETTNYVYARLAIKNDASFSTSKPFYVGVTNISDANVTVKNYAGCYDGVYYYDYSDLIEGSVFAASQETGYVDATFYNPLGISFTYDLVYLTSANEAPIFSSVPRTDALVGKTYVYDADAIDADGDSLAYSLLTAPNGAKIDAKTGAVSWTPTTDQLGNFEFEIQVVDGNGGAAVQRYTVEVEETALNRAPVITSTPTTSTTISSTSPGQKMGDVYPDLLIFDETDDVFTSKISIDLGDFDSGIGSADVVFVVDESGSMSGEQAWIREMIVDLDASLEAQGVVDNRYGLVGFANTPRTFTNSSNESFMTVNEFINSAKYLSTNRSGDEDGYYGSYYALNNYDFRESAVPIVILITDEGRTVVNSSITYSSLVDEVVEKNALFHGIFDANFYDSQNNRALGVDYAGDAFLAGSDSSYTITSGGYCSYGDANTKDAYVNLLWEEEVKGTAWDLNILRNGGTSAAQFSNAFVDYVTHDVVGRIPITITVDEGVEGVTNLSGEQTGQAGAEIASFEVQIDTKVAPDYFYVYFENAETGERLGAIPAYFKGDGLYVYQVEAYDPDFDVLTYSLTTSPEGMWIDSKTGMILWSPDYGQQGEHNVTVEVSDGRGGVATQSFVVTVIDETNTAPVIVSEPVTEIIIDTAQEGYQNDLCFTVPGVPGEEITTTFTWTFRFATFDNEFGIYKVDSSDGAIGGVLPSQPEYASAVFKDGNYSIIFTSGQGAGAKKEVTLIAGQVYAFYLIQDNTSENYLKGKAGALFSYPEANYDGQYDHLITQVSDEGILKFYWEDFAYGGDKSFNDVVYTIDCQLKPGARKLYEYQVVAIDQDDDDLIYRLVDGPKDSKIDSKTGLIQWTSELGSYDFTVEVSDGRGGYDTQTYTLLVTEGKGSSSISGYVVDDANRNDVQDDGEGYLANQIVWLDQNQNGKLDAEEKQTLSDENGYYCFENLSQETYYVRYQAQDGYVQTFPTEGIEAIEYPSDWNFAALETYEGASILVTTEKDVVDANDGLTSLREAVQQARDGDVITFTKELQGKTISLNGSQLYISQSITIDASGVWDGEKNLPGLQIDANKKSRVFEIASGVSVSLVGLEAVNGYSAIGGAVYSNGNLTVKNCSFVGNYANGTNPPNGGGAINIGGNVTLNVYSSYFYKNGCWDDCGAIYSRCPSTQIEDSYFAENYSKGFWANNTGAVSATGRLYIKNTSFIENVCYEDTRHDWFCNAAVWYEGQDCEIENCIFDSNTGGGLSISRGGIATATNSIFTNSRSQINYGECVGVYNGTVNLYNCTLTQNSDEYDCPCLRQEGGTVNIYNSVIVGKEGSSKSSVVSNSTLNAYNTLSDYQSWSNAFDSNANNYLYDPSKSLFTDANSKIYSLTSDSQAVNKGNNEFVSSEYDVSGNARIARNLVDLGAWEFDEKSDDYYIVELSENQKVTNRNFGAYQEKGTSSISGRVVDDANRNGIQDEDEGYLANQTVWLDQNQNGKVDSDERRTTTDANGYYCFSNLASGVYYVHYQTGGDYVQTFPTDGEWNVGENLILNGDFENVVQFSGEYYECYVGSTAIADWNVVSGSVSIHAPSLHQTYDGLYCIDLQGTSKGSMSQTIKTVPGTRYVVQYAISGTPHGSPVVKRYTISTGAETFAGTFDTSNTSAADMGWEVRTWRFVATDSETTLTFSGLDYTGCGPCVDDVFVAPTTQAVAGGYTVVLGASQTAKDRNFGAYKQDVPTPTLDIVSVAPTSATVGEAYRYDVLAVDSDGEKLTYSLLVAPDGMTIIPETGVVVWTPKDADVGTCQVVVSVKNESGLTDAQTFTIDVSDVNHCPVLFTDSFPTPAFAGSEYVLQIEASDPDGDELTYTFDAQYNGTAPEGMTIDAQSGKITWTPTLEQLGEHTFTFAVVDDRGAYIWATGVLEVAQRQEVVDVDPKPEETEDNAAPILLTSKVPGAYVGVDYDLTIEACDPDGDAFAFSFDPQYGGVAPEGMTIDAETGKISWTPTVEQVGAQTFTVVVLDERGAYVTGTATITVVDAREVVDVDPESKETEDNAAPILLTSKVPGAYVGVDYDLTIEARDPDGDAFTFSFDPQYGGVAPEGMTINAETGKISWKPTAEQLGEQTFTVVVLDERGAYVTGTATITVVENVEPEPDLNRKPEILSSPSDYALTSVEYVYYPQIYDPNGDVVVVSLIDAPEKAKYDAESGKFSWTPGDDMAGKTVVVTIKVEDPSGAYDTQTWEIDVYSSYVNQAPDITSTPGVTVILGEEYAYDVVATDPENDALIYSLENAPEGMVVDALTGKVRWTPTKAELGYNAVSILVSDGAGNTVRQQFNVYVGTYNLPPQITSSAPGGVYAGNTYVYAVVATDPEKQPLSYRLGDAPEGMTIDSTTGQVRWETSSADVGEHTFAVIVSDGVNQVGAAYNIVVVEKASQDESGNRYPIIKSEPWQYGEVGVLYEYDVVAEDPDGDELTYSLREAPDGATIDAQTGALHWTPTQAQIGVSNFVVVVTDSKGLAVEQEFNFLVREKNTAPVITSTPDNFVYTRSLYSYDVSAYDPDGDAIFYAIESGPEGATIDSNGRFRWTADATLGEHSITISATDSRGNTQTQTWTLNVEAQGPAIQIVADEESYPVGKNFSFYVSLSSRVGIKNANVKVTQLDGTAVNTISIRSSATITANVPQQGEYLIRVEATDVDGFSSIEAQKILCSGVDPSAPVANISEPDVESDEVLIQKATDIVGDIYDPDGDLEYYTVSIGEYGLDPEQEDGWRVLSRVDKDPNSDEPLERRDAVLYRFDPSTFADGWYTMRVEGYDARGNKGGVTIDVFVLADSDWANFSFAFTDLNAQTSSIPYVMTRGYDTRLCEQDGEFGYGWTHTFRDLLIQTNVKSPDADGLGLYEPFVYGSSKITVTLPDGSKDVFKFKLGDGTDSTDYYTSTAYNLMGVYSPSFECATDSGATLTVDGSSQFQLNKLRILDSGECYTWNMDYAYNPFNPALNSGFTYTTKEGLAYHIDAQTMKVDSISDTCGNKLVFKGNEILDENGASVVTITRDSHSRITAITLADGRSVNYTYDANGNLSTFTGLDKQTITYCYFDTVKGKEHYIRSILDAEGNEALSLQYDDLGRVIGLADVTGAGINVSYDTDNFVRTTTDQLGNTTVETLDDYGNVIKTVTPEGGVTTATYDDCGNKLTETTIVYNADGSVFTELTTKSTYDAHGNVASDTDVYGVVTTYTYDKFGQIASTTTNGITTSTKYDSKTGAPVSDTDRYGNVTLYEVGSKGTITSMTNENGDLLFENTVDASGHVIKSESASGNTIYYSYDSHGNQVESWYYNGTTKVLDKTLYDDADREIGTERYVDGVLIESTSTTYNANGLETLEIDEYGLITEYTYDRNGNETLCRKQAFEGSEKVWYASKKLYDAAGRIIAQTDDYREGTNDPIPGTTTTYNKDGYVVKNVRVTGLVISIDENGDSTLESSGSEIYSESTSYNNAGWKTGEVDKYGLTTNYDYDKFGNVVKITSEVVDENGNILHMIEENVYDSQGRLYVETESRLETVNAPGTQYVYDSYGNIIETIKLSNVCLKNVVELSGTASYRDSVVSADVCYSEKTTYNSTGKRVASIDQYGTLTSYEYNSYGNQVKRTEGNVVTTFVYNDSGKVVEQTVSADGVSLTEKYEYDGEGRLIKTTYADGTTFASTYDALGNLTSETNRKGQVKRYEYDHMNRLSAVVIAAGTDFEARYEYQYDANGNRTVIRDALGHETRYLYDTNGNVLSRTLPLGYGVDGVSGTSDDSKAEAFTERFEYDAFNRATRAVSFEGVVARYEYDAWGRLTETTFYASEADETTGKVDEVLTYKTDVYGRTVETTKTDGNGVEVRKETTSYVDSGRVQTVTTPEGTIRYEYDVYDRLTHTSSDKGDDVYYTYDALNRLATVRNAATDDLTTTYSYDAFGNLAKAATSTGVTTTYEYDEFNRLIKTTNFVDKNSNGVWDSGEDRISQFEYDYDALGQKTSSTEYWGNDEAKTIRTAWEYDGQNRLVKEVFDSYDDSLDQTLAWTYDLNGNRLSQTRDAGNDGTVDEQTVYNYDANDRLTREAFDGDADGLFEETTDYSWLKTKLAEKIVSENGTITKQTTYAYNAQGLTSEILIVENNATTRVRYEYDAVGARVATTEEIDADGDGTFEKSTRTEYLNDANNQTGYTQVLRKTETDEKGAQTVTSYTIGLDQIAQTVVAPDGTETTNLFSYDGHGSVRALTDLVGAVLETYAYDAFGNAIGFDPATASTDYLYDGEIFDATTGLLYLRARDYDPATGRFTTLDPFYGDVNDPQSLHKYAFTLNNPINRVDPAGLSSSAEMMVVMENLGGILNVVTDVLNVYSRALSIIDGIQTIKDIIAFASSPDLFTILHYFKDSGESVQVRVNFNEAIDTLSRNSIAIVRAIFCCSADMKFINAVKRLKEPGAEVLIMLPTPYGVPDKLNRYVKAPSPKKIGKYSVALFMGLKSWQGRLIGLATSSKKVVKPEKVNQLFRMDYHSPHQSDHKDCMYYWEDSPYHFHILAKING